MVDKRSGENLLAIWIRVEFKSLLFRR